jgi:hypothetical protein
MFAEEYHNALKAFYLQKKKEEKDRKQQEKTMFIISSDFDKVRFALMLKFIQDFIKKSDFTQEVCFYPPAGTYWAPESVRVNGVVKKVDNPYVEYVFDELESSGFKVTRLTSKHLGVTVVAYVITLD